MMDGRIGCRCSGWSQPLRIAWVNDKLVTVLQQQPHARLAIGTIVQPLEGFDTMTGLDLDQFSKMSGGFHFLEGGPFQRDDDILVDEFYPRQKNIHAGDSMQLSSIAGTSRASSSQAS
jgi:putative ABC transport system permease protein